MRRARPRRARDLELRRRRVALGDRGEGAGRPRRVAAHHLVRRFGRERVAQAVDGVGRACRMIDVSVARSLVPMPALFSSASTAARSSFQRRWSTRPSTTLLAAMVSTGAVVDRARSARRAARRAAAAR